MCFYSYTAVGFFSPSLILLQQLLLLGAWRSSLQLPSLLLMMPLPSQWSGYFMHLPTYVTPIRESLQHLLCNTFSARPSTLRSSGGTAGLSLEEECSRRLEAGCRYSRHCTLGSKQLTAISFFACKYARARNFPQIFCDRLHSPFITETIGCVGRY